MFLKLKHLKLVGLLATKLNQTWVCLTDGKNQALNGYVPKLEMNAMNSELFSNYLLIRLLDLKLFFKHSKASFIEP